VFVGQSWNTWQLKNMMIKVRLGNVILSGVKCVCWTIVKYLAIEEHDDKRIDNCWLVCVGDDKYILFVYKLSSSWILTLMETSYWVIIPCSRYNGWFFLVILIQLKQHQIQPPKMKLKSKTYGVLSYSCVLIVVICFLIGKKGVKFLECGKGF
jgi:hypothetical protein